jgi:hypothetical protein
VTSLSSAVIKLLFKNILKYLLVDFFNQLKDNCGDVSFIKDIQNYSNFCFETKLLELLWFSVYPQSFYISSSKYGAGVPYSPPSPSKFLYHSIRLVELILNIEELFGAQIPCKSYRGSKFPKDKGGPLPFFFLFFESKF